MRRRAARARGRLACCAWPADGAAGTRRPACPCSRRQHYHHHCLPPVRSAAYRCPGADVRQPFYPAHPARMPLLMLHNVFLVTRSLLLAYWFAAAAAASAPAAGYSGASCTVPLVASAALNNYNLIVHEPWRGVPEPCAGGRDGERWNFISLNFAGAVEGVQFDRYGGLWFAGVELLRTTTPEPATGVDRGGTHWSISKDITDYASLFAHATAGVTKSSLTIPNTVTDVYTGTQYIRVTATFHMADRPSPTPPPTIIPLLDPTANPWAITGLTNTSAPLQRPIALSSAHAGRVKRLYLDIYASNHGGSEEFWCKCTPDILFFRISGACRAVDSVL